jgi:hypothetical protein
MTDSTMRQDMESWIDLCRAFLAGTSEPPYLDGVYEILPADVPVRENEHDEEVIYSYERIAEGFLAQNPADLAVRFAVLYPLRAAGMRYLSKFSRPSPQLTSTFQRLMGIGNPERLSDLRNLKFELHNTYLAGQWGRGIEILRRIPMIGTLGAAEISALRGHYMFLSVWGRSIEWDLEQHADHYPESHNCFWPDTLPWGLELGNETRHRLSELRSFARPELIEPGTAAHWILTAWSTNPRSPRLVNIWPELDFSAPEVPPIKKDSKDGSAPMRKYVQNLYRDFEPIAQPRLDEAGIERLQHARINLEDTATMSPGLGSIYRRFFQEFCLS